jgi:hypothetical protein
MSCPRNFEALRAQLRVTTTGAGDVRRGRFDELLRHRRKRLKSAVRPGEEVTSRQALDYSESTDQLQDLDIKNDDDEHYDDACENITRNIDTHDDEVDIDDGYANIASNDAHLSIGIYSDATQNDEDDAVQVIGTDM